MEDRIYDDPIALNTVYRREGGPWAREPSQAYSDSVLIKSKPSPIALIRAGLAY